MKRLELVPTSFACTLRECPPGLFITEGSKSVGLKTEYGPELEAFCDSGEAFWGGARDRNERNKVKVIPVKAAWIDDEEAPLSANRKPEVKGELIAPTRDVLPT